VKLEFKPSLILAIVAWASVFVLGWLLVLRLVPADKLSWVFFALWFVVGTMASAVYRGKAGK